MSNISLEDVINQVLEQRVKIALLKIANNPDRFVKCEDDNCTMKAHFLNIAFSEGNCRKAYKALYCKGEKKKRWAVVKRFKQKSTFDISDWYPDMRAYHTAKVLADVWNKLNFINKKLIVTTAEIYTSAKNGELLFVEDFIEGKFEKWNSNNGWNSHQDASIHAFCHWTFHITNGKILFCDAQGVRGTTAYYITDPCILSPDGSRGMTDCGFDYIKNWFFYHKCNKFCNSQWLKPSSIEKKLSIKVSKGTTYNDTFKTKYGTNNNKQSKNIKMIPLTEEKEEE